MNPIANSLALVLAISFLGCAERSFKSTADVRTNSTQRDGDSAVSDLTVEPPSIEPGDILFGDKFPKVLAAEATPKDNGDWSFNVTLSSVYDTPERYADAWRVLDDKNHQLGIRILGHDHGNEQPFTRSGTVQIPKAIGTVFIEGRDQLNGWSGQRFELKIPSL